MGWALCRRGGGRLLSWIEGEGEVVWCVIMIWVLALGMGYTLVI